MAEPAVPAGFDVRRILLLGGVVFVLLFAALFFVFRSCSPAIRGTGGFTVIYSNLELRDAANVIARLKELTIPYEIRENGRAIAIPKLRADEARLGLAEKNLPAGGVVGWEIFDESKLGATDFDRRIQLIRAISGELSRTIRRIEAIEDVRVQIVMPETRLFAENVAPVTASVMLRLRPGAELSAGKINGIVHLVASSVENLLPENVTVIDNTGRILTAKTVGLTSGVINLPIKEEALAVPLQEVVTASEEVVAETAATPEAVKLTVEAEARAEIVSEEAVALTGRPPSPEEKILLKVQAKKELEEDLGGKAQEILNRFYPPNSVIVKVNVDFNSSQKDAMAEEAELKFNKLSAVILIDNRVEVSQELKEATYKSVAAAIGYNSKRGDRILLQKVPFHLATPPPEVIRSEVAKVLPPIVKEETTSLPILFWWRYLVWLIGVGTTILLIMYIFRLVKPKPAPVKVVPRQQVSEVRKPVDQAKASTLDRVKSMANGNPELVAEMLKKWLSE
ncbi:flagellar M-ring protein FliF [candidate division WOR-1 bacterium RIFCSPLOWO2_12_FULL_45_9]|uniref:Flagellar M-ring protein FliF n=1 Tax=candidate division WOR-1 bacterium RIFCSPLOWO2_12_FULL_45_9 TaxID=1802568 RepID=A0A1F4RKE1_UNCSA|nr:MAG: flagellar M-ring protein FliF [candidate division WOR-1 bacterium RIFCSPLOWO2_12_FULL_45_9]